MRHFDSQQKNSQHITRLSFNNVPTSPVICFRAPLGSTTVICTNMSLTDGAAVDKDRVAAVVVLRLLTRRRVAECRKANMMMMMMIMIVSNEEIDLVSV